MFVASLTSLGPLVIVACVVFFVFLRRMRDSELPQNDATRNPNEMFHIVCCFVIARPDIFLPFEATPPHHETPHVIIGIAAAIVVVQRVVGFICATLSGIMR